MALAKGGTVYPKDSLFMDCQAVEMDRLVALVGYSGAVRGMHWPNNYVETDCHRTIGPPRSEMVLIHNYT